MKRSLLSIAMAALSGAVGFFRPQQVSSATPSRRVRARHDGEYDGMQQSSRDDGLPRGYAGAKLARKAALSQAAVKHLGLRAEFKPSR